MIALSVEFEPLKKINIQRLELMSNKLKNSTLNLDKIANIQSINEIIFYGLGCPLLCR